MSGPRAGRREWAGLAVLSLPTLLLAIDNGVLFLAVPAISEDLRPDATQLLWIMDSYGFMMAGFLVTMGTLGDRIGHRRLLMIGATAFGTASALAAYAPSAELLLAGRVALGIAGATLMLEPVGIFASFGRSWPSGRAVSPRAPRSGRWSAARCWRRSGGARRSSSACR
jgi:DHA2 family multidrug resistance protein-like MFS transporter